MNIIKKIARRNRERQLIQTFAHSYLWPKGWINSYRQGGSVDQSGAPIPWITYPATMMLRRIVQPDFRVLEYGCGNSSLWWAGLVKSVVSVEHGAEWAKKIAKVAPKNLEIVLRERGAVAGPSALVDQFFSTNKDLPSVSEQDDLEHGFNCNDFVSYAREIERFGTAYFDVVIVDGMARSLTAWLAGNYVKPDGFIVFDNSERWQYNPGFQALSDTGFKRIDFYGPGPLSTHEHCTSIYSRSLQWAEPGHMISEVFRSK